MKWSKAKTIFIYIFIFVNLFLFTVYKMNSSKSRQISEENIAIIMNRFGVTGDISSFVSMPAVMEQLEAESDLTREEVIGAFFEKEYAEKESGVYTSSTETLTVNGNYFEYSDTSPERRDFSGINKLNAASKAISYLGGLGISEKTLDSQRVTENSDGSYTVSINYKYGKYPVFESGIYITENKNGILSAKGKLLFLRGIKNQYYNTIGGTEAVIEYLSGYGHLLTKKKETAGFGYGYYVSEQPGSVSFSAIPAYEVKFTDGSVVFIDGREDIDPGYRVLN